MTEQEKNQEGDSKARKRSYAVIRFPGKRRGSTDPDIIYVGVHGDKVNLNLRMQRNEFIPVHRSVIQVLKNAQEPVMENTVEDPHNQLAMRRRKAVKYTPRFPFELVCWITKRTFEELRSISKKRSITQEEIDAVMETA